MTRRCRMAALVATVLAVEAVVPSVASAHGLVGKADLPIPVWLFSWTAAIVLVVSFVALSTLWTEPQLQHERLRRLFAWPTWLERIPNAIGLALFGLVVYSGFAGAQVPTANFSVTFIYVIFWVGLPVVSVLVGNVFPAFSPWRSVARGIVWAGRRVAPVTFQRPLLQYPRRLGMWPAAAVLAGFAWLELVYVSRDQPSILAGLAIGYFVVMVAGMVLCGVEEWEQNVDGFAADFALIARLSAVKYDRGVVYLRRPLSGLAEMEMRPGTVALICTIIGTTTFDGLSNGAIWRAAGPPLKNLFADIGFGQTPALELAYTVGLFACIGLAAGIYRIGVSGVRSVSSRYGTSELTRLFAHTLAPIGFAYVFAHYFSLLIWQGQAMGYLISDPLGNGSNLFGTGHWQINYAIVSFSVIWYVQVFALVLGHVGGLTLAHDRAISIYRNMNEAVRSQYWMLVVMVAFTAFGLWILSAVGT